MQKKKMLPRGELSWTSNGAEHSLKLRGAYSIPTAPLRTCTV